MVGDDHEQGDAVGHPVLVERDDADHDEEDEVRLGDALHRCTSAADAAIRLTRGRGGLALAAEPGADGERSRARRRRAGRRRRRAGRSPAAQAKRTRAAAHARGRAGRSPGAAAARRPRAAADPRGAGGRPGAGGRGSRMRDRLVPAASCSRAGVLPREGGQRASDRRSRPARGDSSQIFAGGMAGMPSSVGWPRTGPVCEWSRWLRGVTSCGVAGGQRRLAVALDALGVGPVERQAGEELGRHAAAAAGVEVRALRAGAAGLRAAQLGEQLATAATPAGSRPRRGRCRRGSSRGWRTGRRRRRRPGRSGRPPARRRRGSARAAPRRTPTRWKNESPVSTLSPLASSQS